MPQSVLTTRESKHFYHYYKVASLNLVLVWAGWQGNINEKYVGSLREVKFIHQMPGDSPIDGELQ